MRFRIYHQQSVVALFTIILFPHRHFPTKIKSHVKRSVFYFLNEKKNKLLKFFFKKKFQKFREEILRKEIIIFVLRVWHYKERKLRVGCSGDRGQSASLLCKGVRSQRFLNLEVFWSRVYLSISRASASKVRGYWIWML